MGSNRSNRETRLADLPLINLSPFTSRRIWLAPDLKCPSCSWPHRAALGNGDLWLACQNKHCDRTRWRAITIYPGMIGASLIALFGDADHTDVAREILHRILPQTIGLSEDDLWGFELVEGSRVAFLQWQVSKLEAHRDSQDATLGRRVLRALGGM